MGVTKAAQPRWRAHKSQIRRIGRTGCTFANAAARRQPARPAVFRQRSGGAPKRRLNARLKPAS
ncbi:MAG TPA: hypothetical protein VF477_12900, partial [Mycobacterium sp.]